MISLVPSKLVAIINKSMIPRSTFLKWLVLFTILNYGPIDVISNPHRLKSTHWHKRRKPENYLSQMAIIL